MKLKVSELFAAVPVLAAVINEKRPIPVKGNYRVARMYTKLKPEFDIANTSRDEIITRLGTEVMEAPKSAEDPLGTGEPQPTGRYQVSMERMPEFNAEWAKIADEEIEVEVQPLPLDSLGDTGIYASEFLALGPLVAE